jgi:hypothetical protein
LPKESQLSGETIKKYTCSTVSQAPESPGLYAWYGKVDIGDSDYLRLIIEGKDAGESRFRSLLARHTQRHNLPGMHVRIRSSFESEWRATCEEITTERFIEAQSGQVDDELISDQEAKRRLNCMDKTVSKQKSRQLLKEVLQESVPVFSAPLYIGVTDNLRRRLTEHVALLERFARALEREPNAGEVLRQHATSPHFALRALAAGFDENYLEVHVLNFAELVPGGYSTEELREVAESAEWILNRWHRPYLGRR